jgi:hypothetical protein
MEQINIQLLQQTYRRSDKYAAVFDYLAERQRNYRETKPEILVMRMRESGTDLERSEIISFFRELETAGCGKYIEGRRGHSSRFEWYAPMNGVGLAAKGEQNLVEGLVASEAVPPVNVDSLDREESIAHTFYLRPDFPIKILLPKDLRSVEAERIADWVKTLPFNLE